jgi:hypothetical protein
MNFNFFKKKRKPSEQELYQIRKDLIDKELELYKKGKMHDIDVMAHQYKEKRHNEMTELSLTCSRQTAEYEHTFHDKREQLGIEIAKLEATKEYLESQVGTLNRKLLRD